MAATDFLTANHTLGLPKLPVKNTSGTAMTAGQLVKLDTSNPLSATQGAVGVVLTSAVTDYGIGITAEAIPAGGYGGIYGVDGQAVWGIAAGAITIGLPVGASAATPGDVIAYTATDPSFGIALTAAVNAADPILILIAKSKNA